MVHSQVTILYVPTTTYSITSIFLASSPVVVALVVRVLDLDCTLLPLLVGQGQVHVKISGVVSVHITHWSHSSLDVWFTSREEIKVEKFNLIYPINCCIL